MNALWASLGAIFGGGGLLFSNGPELIAGVFCVLMAIVGVAVHEVRLYRRCDMVAHKPEGQMRIGLAQVMDDRTKDAA